MRIYLDYNATTPLDEEVLAAMQPYLTNNFGNASSSHTEGRIALDAVEQARSQIATAINANPNEIIFTSSGTESNNMIIKGVASKSAKKIIATSAIEHPCVHCAARYMARRGYIFNPITVDDLGILETADLEDCLNSNDVAIVSVMLANNETGVIQDIKKIANIVKQKNVVMHTDAAQALGKIPVDFKDLSVDAMTISAHKLRGPMGVAAIVIKEDVDFEPLLEGGGQENGARSGTLNVPGIVGFGKAAEIASKRVATEYQRLANLQEMLETKLEDAGAIIFSKGAKRLVNTTYFGFQDIEGESLVVMLDQNGFAVTSGAACASNKNEASHVLMAMGVSEMTARTAIRCSLGLETTEEQVLNFATTTSKIVAQLKNLAAVS